MRALPFPRIVAFVASLAVMATGYAFLGNARSAEGPPQGGAVTVAAAPGSGAKPAVTAGDPRSGEPALRAPGVPVEATTPVRRDLRQELQVTGTLKTDDVVEIGSRVEGKVRRVLVKEGDRVAAGQVLAEIDDRELRAQLGRAQALVAAAEARLSVARNQASVKDASAKSEHERAVAALDQAKSRLQQAQTNAEIVDKQTRTQVAAAEAGVKAAQERLTVVLSVTRKQELRQEELGVDQARAELGQAKVDADNARQVWERRRMLFQQDAIAREEVDEADRKYQNAQARVRSLDAAVASAQQRVELAKEGSRPEEITIARGQLAAAQRALRQAQSDERRREVAQNEIDAAKAAVEQAEAAVRTSEAGLVQSRLSQDEIAAARAQIAQARGDVAFYKTQIADAILRAPVAGVISAKQVDAGESVTRSTRLLTLVALNGVYLEALVPELEVGSVRNGMPARVTVDSIPGRTFTGTIREIIPVADRSSRQFRTRVAVAAGNTPLPTGGYARAAVQVGTHAQALSLPKEAIQSQSGNTFVWLIETRQGREIAVRQPVRVGLRDGDTVEILDGVKPGQRIVGAGAANVTEGAGLAVSG